MQKRGEVTESVYLQEEHWALVQQIHIEMPFADSRKEMGFVCLSPRVTEEKIKSTET